MEVRGLPVGQPVALDPLHEVWRGPMNNAFDARRHAEPWDPDMLYTHLCRCCRTVWQSTTNGGQVMSRICPTCIEKRTPRAGDEVLNRLIRAERRAALGA